MPKAPEDMPPKKAKKIKLKSCLPEYRMSDGTMPTPIFSFKACSDLLIFKPQMLKKSIAEMKVQNTIQSEVEHLCISTMDSVFLEPLKKVTTIVAETANKQRSCLLIYCK